MPEGIAPKQAHNQFGTLGAREGFSEGAQIL